MSRCYNLVDMAADFVRAVRARARSVYYGWWITAAGTLLNALSSGFYSTGFTVYFLPLSRDLNLSRTATSVIFGISRLEGGVQGLITGYCIDRWGPRIMMVIGALLAALGFMLLPAARNYATFLIVYVGLISLGVHTGYNQGVMATVNRWFVRRRGTAFGVVSLGIALGGAAITPVLSIIVLNMGWRVAALMSGVVLLVVGLPLSLLMRGSPEEMGRLPDGDVSAAPAREATPARFVPVEGVDFSARQAFASFSYWLLAVGICFRISAHVGVFTHMVPLMVWKGLDERTGAVMVSILSFSGMATRLLMGWWGDRWSKRQLVALAMVAGAGSLLFLVFSGGYLWQMVLFAVAFSVTDGAAGLTWALVGDYFGRRAFATLRGGVNLVVSLGALAAPIFSGRVFDLTESYYWALLPFAGLYVVTAGIFLVLRRPRPRPRTTTR